MIAVCPNCGAANDVPTDVAHAVCQKCSEPFPPVSIDEVAAQRRALWRIVGGVLLLFVVLTILLLAPNRSGVVRGAREVVFGAPLAERFGGGGIGNGSGDGNGSGGSGAGGGRSGGGRGGGRFGSGSGSGPGSDIPDAQATNIDNTADNPIGRAPVHLGERKPGDEVRPGPAGTDEPAKQIGNSRDGVITKDNSAGGNPGNSTRNSTETPNGADLRTGLSSGDDSGGVRTTNVSPSTLLLDDFSERLRQAGARSGDVQISLEWKNVNDLDLHVVDPRGEEIFYNHRTSESGGLLDVDMNASNLTWRPVENIYWPERGAPKGAYRVDVVHYANHGSPDPTPFSVRVINKGQVSYFRGVITYQPSQIRARVTVCQFAVR